MPVEPGKLVACLIVQHTIGSYDERKTDDTHDPHRHRPAMCVAGRFAQELTAEQRNACMGDFEKYCKGVVPGGGRIIACLAKESDKLTPACKKVLEAAEKK